jgi:succinoglycan biosynthesis transport protein ExoP
MGGQRFSAVAGLSVKRKDGPPGPTSEDSIERVSFPGVWRLFVRHAPLALSIVALGLWLAWNSLSHQERRYEASATIVLDAVAARLDPGQTQVRRAFLSQSEINTEVEVMRSHDFVARVVEELELFNDPDFGGGPVSNEASDRVEAARALVPKLLSMYWLDFRPGTLTIDIHVVDSNAERTARIANGLASAYIRYAMDVQQGGLKQRIEFLEQSLQRVRENLTEAELDTAAFIRVNDLDNQQTHSNLVARLDRIEAQIDIARRLGESVAELEEEKASINAALTEWSAAELTRLGLERQLNRLNVREDLFSDQLDALQAQLDIVVPVARQMALALPPAEPSFPNVNTGLAGAGVGSAAMAFVAVLFAASFDTRIRETSRYSVALRLRPVGRIPRLPFRDRWTARRLIERFASDRKLPDGDTLRHTSTTLRRKCGREGSFVLMITSARPGEGRSTIAMALATIEAKAGERVLLIDLNRPGHGVSELLQAPRSQHSLGEMFENTFIMLQALQGPIDPAGVSLVVPSSEGFLPRSLMRRLADDVLVVLQHRGTLEMLRTRYDLIVIDVPPVLSDDTALRLATLADETLLVVRMNRTRLRDLSEAVSLLRANNLEPCGTVENYG